LHSELTFTLEGRSTAKSVDNRCTWGTDETWSTVSAGKPTGSACIFVTNQQIYNKTGTSYYCKEDLEIFNELTN